MELAKRTQVQTLKPGRTPLRRGILFTALTIFCVICFWYALSGVSSPPCPLSVGQGTDSTACGTGSGGHARPSGLGAILSGQANSKTTLSAGNSHVPVGSQPTSGGNSRSGGKSVSPAGGSSITSASAGGLAMSNATSGGSSGSSNPLTCRSQCQTSGLTCQTACARQYNVTSQTQNWATCMQTCGSKMSVCANSCLSGLKPPSNAQVPVASSAAQSASGSRSGSGPATKATPSLPIQMPDSSSSSSSSQ
jgi:hypothetical protein